MASALATSLDRILNLAKSLFYGIPIPKSDNTTQMGSRIGAEILGMERVTSPSRFQSATASAQEDS